MGVQASVAKRCGEKPARATLVDCFDSHDEGLAGAGVLSEDGAALIPMKLLHEAAIDVDFAIVVHGDLEDQGTARIGSLPEALRHRNMHPIPGG
jgi:uncharacterized protein YbjT (DUF2867 family)